MAQMLGDVTKQVVARAIAISGAATLAGAEIGTTGTDRPNGAAGPCRAVTNSQMGAAINDEPSPAAEGRPVMPFGMDRRTTDEVFDPSLVGQAPAPFVRRPMLMVIEGGGARREEGCNVRRLRVSPRSKARELGIRVVVGG